MVKNTIEYMPKKEDWNWANHFIDKNRVENTKFDTNLTIQVVWVIEAFAKDFIPSDSLW